jgi:catechol 2,3-dioxygenase-like lactoylglutathione lyase family enzyme
MPILALHHIQLAMPRGDENRARVFYGGVLGFEEVPKPEELAGRGGVWFRAGTAEVHLGIEDDFVPAKKAHPALLVDDLPAVVQACEAAGHPTEEGKPLKGYVRADVHDPFGNRIELLQRL